MFRGWRRKSSGANRPRGSGVLRTPWRAFTPEELRALGERYLSDTRSQRKTRRPFFIDKMPNNFAYAGLIHLMLPNARIIDARRHPLGCCFSGFKQHFARGQSYTYGLEDIGRYYRDYVEWMAHIDAVLPGRVHRVMYEALVEDTETEVRGLLDYCGLPSRRAASNSMRTAGPCARPVPSRCAGPSIAKDWISGAISNHGWAP